MTGRSGTTGDRLAEIDCPECDGRGWWRDYCDECYRRSEWCGCGGEQRQCPTCGGTGLVALARLDSGAAEGDA